MPRIRAMFVGGLVLAAVCVTVETTRAADDAAPGSNAGTSEPGRGSLALLRLEKVQQDLGLSAEQTDQIKKVVAEQAKASEAIRGQLENLTDEQRKAKLEELQATFKQRRKEIATKLDAILSADQRTRLHEIYLQVHGTAALNHQDIAEALKLTDDQRAKLKEIRAATVKSIHDAAETARTSGDQAGLSKTVAAIAKEASAKALDVLTAEQRQQFDSMQGKKLEINRSQLGFGAAG